MIIFMLRIPINNGASYMQESEEYDARMKEVQEEQAKYRKALELELKKLRTEVRHPHVR